MKILYIINSADYKYHIKLVEDFINVTGGEVIDTTLSDPGKQYYIIQDAAPDVVITFDLAGHVFRTGSDTLSLNNIYARFAHILFHKTDRYGRDLRKRQNLSMFTYIPVNEDIESVRASLPDLPNVNSFVSISYKPSNDEERAENITNITHWWNEFKKEAML